MSYMEYIRKHYNVPARRGMRVKTLIGKGYICASSRGGRIKVKIDGEKRSRIFHPLLVEYLNGEINAA